MMKNYDVIIVGGGLMGSSVAFNLLRDGFTGSIAIFEKDRMYEYASTPRSSGGVRRTFSSEVNIKMSEYSLEVYKNFEQDMSREDEQAKIDFKQNGYLYLVSEQTYPMFEKNMELQKNLGVDVEFLSPQETLQLIPELNVGDLVGSVFDREGGNADPYSVMQLYKKHVQRMGGEYIHEEIDSLLSDNLHQISGVKSKSGELYFASIVVNAAGAWAGDISKTIGLELPIMPYRKQMFFLDTAVKFQKEIPFTFDVSGTHFRGETGQVIVGKAEDIPYGYNFNTDVSFFEKEVWPILAERSPIFEQLKIVNKWAGLYDYNTIDQNAIIGEHPEMKGYYIAAGYSGHGFQQGPATGKALSELIRLGRFETIDLTPCSVERFAKKELLYESEIF